MLYLFDTMMVVIDVGNLNRYNYSHQVLNHRMKVIVKMTTDSDMNYLLSKLKLGA